ncbi:mismatch-specific DNA-glycosylase [Falsiroseomonas sp. E2-1-a20]|uniref:mismatch-specific DNA-glycosylase n=1 Tax=Falsiroseomonas sp. E2-1-a20 TaxID=3239300 RepID=UPI003F375005
MSEDVHADPGRDVLPDVLEPGLRLVFCGMAAGPTSARLGAYYARPGNRFWPALATAGFTKRLFRPHEFRLLAGCGIGLTDLGKGQQGVDRQIVITDRDRARLREAILREAPGALAFTSKSAAGLFLRQPGLPFGALPDALVPPGFPPTFVLPSTSGSNNGNWDRFGYQAIWTDTAMRLGFVNPVQA